VQSLTKQRTNELALKQKYYQQWQCQLYGGPGCPAGNGQLAQASHANYEQASSQVTSLTDQIQRREQQLSASDTASQKSRLDQATSALPAAQQQLKVATARQNALQANFDAQNEVTNGLLIRLQALDQLSRNNFTVNSARFLLFLLFLVIECLPVTVKLMQQPGNYEKILETERAHELSEARQAYRRNRRTSAQSDGPQRPGETTDILEIFERQARNKITQPDATADAMSPLGRFHPEPDPDMTVAEDEDLSISDRALRDLRDERVSAPSDGHGGGTPLPWDDDDL